jgi:hypothetical protein
MQDYFLYKQTIKNYSFVLVVVVGSGRFFRTICSLLEAVEDHIN